MATFTYNGPDERIFPTISVTVKPGESFEAPDDFLVANVTLAATSKKTAAAPIAPTSAPQADQPTSAASDPAVGE